jgi:hypothetical protein
MATPSRSLSGPTIIGLVLLLGLGGVTLATLSRPSTSQQPSGERAPAPLDATAGLLESADLTATARPAAAPTATTLPTVLAGPTPTAVRAATPSLTAIPSPTVVPSPTRTPAAAAASGANLRAGPGTNYPVAGAVKAGQALSLVGRNSAGDWLELAEGQWILAELVSNAQPGLPVESKIAAPPVPQPQQAPQAPTGAPKPVPPAATSAPVQKAPPTQAPAARSCCKVCTGSKACGNSCISRSYTCRQPPGCACDG